MTMLLRLEPIYGYAGTILRVDLSKGQFGTEREDLATLRKYLGGTCLGAKVIYEEIPSGVKWSDPENRIILASGPLGGTRVKGSGTFSVITKGALTNGATSTQANGYFGAFLKFAGFDSIVIQGRADHLCYLYIHDAQAELRDARHLAGKDTWETEDLIKDELGYSPQAMSVFSVGPAGENMVRFAGLFGDRGHSAAHNGPGAVLGSKNLKAIAVARGRRVKVYDEPRLSSLSNELFNITKSDPGYALLYKWGTLWILETSAYRGRAPLKNYTTSVCPMSEEQFRTFTKEYLRENLDVIRQHPCWRCQMHHCRLIRIPQGPYAGAEGEEPEYEGYTSMGTQLGIWDGMVATALSNEVDRLGMDYNETGWVLGMVMECYEKGLLTKQDTDGIEMTWGNADAVRAMMNKIARREGVGNMLAEGVMRAAQSIGGQAPEFAVHTKSGNTPIGHDHRGIWAYMLDICVANTGCYELHIGPRAQNLGLREPSLHSPTDIATYVGQAKWVAPFFDSLGICRLPNREFPELLVGILNAATGWDSTQEEAIRVGLRAVNLLRAFNIRHGFTPDLEAPSPRYGSVPVDGPFQGKNVAPVWDEMLDTYYREMGWDRPTGKPLPETLRKLDLAYVIPELWPEKS